LSFCRGRTLLTLGNGVTVTYSYDGDSNLSSLTYKNGASTLGNLTYTYDADSRVLQKGGTFARTGLPQPVSSATYDAANQLLRWGDLTLSYDAAGNMLSDGSNAFTWDARGQVSSVNAVSPLYDAFGRRTKNLAGTQMLFDGSNAAQELLGNSVSANRLTGRIDEFFSHADSTGTYYPLSDNLGSTVALTDATANLVTSYTYDPYGATSVNGVNSNLFDYTGRESDGAGFYYYRNRYYPSTLSRFISQDPIGFGGGINQYAYVGNAPIGGKDSFGLDKGHAFGDCLAKHAKDYSLVGIWDLVFDTDNQDTLIGNLAGGNDVTGISDGIASLVSGGGSGDLGNIALHEATPLALKGTSTGVNQLAMVAYQGSYNATLAGSGTAILDSSEYARYLSVVQSGLETAESLNSVGTLLSKTAAGIGKAAEGAELATGVAKWLLDAGLLGVEELECGVGVVH
jgi:RHS repeat-associated protein